MGLFDWIKKLVGVPPAPQPDRRDSPPPTVPSSLFDRLNPPDTASPSPPAVNPPPAPARSAPPAQPAPQARSTPPAERPPPLRLDLAQFSPLSQDDVRRQAGGLMITSNNLWLFGRRSLIPPASDPRTLLIDRAMVGHGLLTPEDLVEIHRLGDEMEKVRPDMAAIEARAQEAMRRSQEERAALKLRKKAEAAERKRRHDEAVKQRKATDIVFLGRGVSRGLADRRANVEKLVAAGLPVLGSPADVAKALGLEIPRLRWLAFHSDAAIVTHYVRFTVPKKSGGERQLFAPRKALAAAQQWIRANILQKVPTHSAAHGFVAGRSTVTNATPHVGRALIVNTDLCDFFPTITFGRVLGIFKQIGYSPAAATILALLCTEPPRREVTYLSKPFHVATGPRALPQGACTSPALSNLAVRRMDSRLQGIAGKLGWDYTRYADDLTFSASASAAGQIGYLMARIRHIAQDEGFDVNEKKTRVQRPASAQTVTGIVVNTRPGVPREQVRRIRAILHRARKEGLAAQNREKLPHFEAWLSGMISYIHMVNPQQAKPLREALAALPR